MRCKPAQALAAVVAVTCLPWVTSAALGSVDLEFRQVPGVVQEGDTVRIGLYAVSDTPGSNQGIAGVDVVFAWDQTALTLLGKVDNGPYGWLNSYFPAGDPFGLNEVVPPADGTGLYLAQGQFGTPAQATPAGLLITTFEFLVIACDGDTLVEVLPMGGTPVQTYTVAWSGDTPGTPVTGNLVSQIVSVTDGTAPVFAACDPIVIDIDPLPGDPCETMVSVSSSVAVSDNCDPAPLLECSRSDGLDCFLDPYPCGVTTLTWTATDAAGNARQCTQTVTVNGVSDVLATVELQGVWAASVERCITFEFRLCDPSGTLCPSDPDPLVLERSIVFTNGIGTAVLPLPCDQYVCVTARDRLHTLGRTITPIPEVGGQRIADFTAANGKELVGGDLNDDGWVDIVDYGLMGSQWGQFIPADTDCTVTSPPVHPDLNADGLVFTADFSFFVINMWANSDPMCCGVPRGPLQGADGPRQRISTKELHRLGYPEAAAGDLNDDGWLDLSDIVLWMQGSRPSAPEKPENTQPLIDTKPKATR